MRNILNEIYVVVKRMNCSFYSGVVALISIIMFCLINQQDYNIIKTETMTIGLNEIIVFIIYVSVTMFICYISKNIYKKLHALLCNKNKLKKKLNYLKKIGVIERRKLSLFYQDGKFENIVFAKYFSMEDFDMNLFVDIGIVSLEEYGKVYCLDKDILAFLNKRVKKQRIIFVDKEELDIVGQVLNL